MAAKPKYLATGKPAKGLIFLDIDGVLCTRKAAHGRGCTFGCLDQWDFYSAGLVKLLCLQMDAALVISSSWRRCPGTLFPKLEQCRLFPHLADPWRIECLYEGNNRWRWIRNYLDDYGRSANVLILDDMPDAFPPKKQRRKLLGIQTRPDEGFGFEEYQRAMRFFGAKYLRFQDFQQVKG